MTKLQTTLVLVAAAVLALMPTANAAELGAITQAPVTDSTANMGTICAIIGVGACAFLCVTGEHLTTQLFFAGQVTASCGGAGDSCVWGNDHILRMEPCQHTGGQVQSDGVGTCIAIAIVLATCQSG